MGCVGAPQISALNGIGMLPLLPSQFMESIHEMMLVISANTMTGLFFCFCSSSFSKMRSYASSQLISSHPGSMPTPFFGFVRFMGFVMRFLS